MNAAILQTPSDAKLLSPGVGARFKPAEARTPARAIRAFCRACLSDNAAEIRPPSRLTWSKARCYGVLQSLRRRLVGSATRVELRDVAFVACSRCCGGQHRDIRECGDRACPAWCYRPGGFKP